MWLELPRLYWIIVLRVNSLSIYWISVLHYDNNISVFLCCKWLLLFWGSFVLFQSSCFFLIINRYWILQKFSSYKLKWSCDSYSYLIVEDMDHCITVCAHIVIFASCNKLHLWCNDKLNLLRKFLFCFCFWAIPCSAYGLFLVCLEITPKGFGRPCRIHWIEPRLVKFKANVQPTVLSLQNQFCWI